MSGTGLRRTFLMRDRQREVARVGEIYAATTSAVNIENRQVQKFNTVWRYCLAEVPFYRRWAADHGLPSSIGSVSDLHDFPVLQKHDIVENHDEIFQGGRIKLAYSTGGTTGTPTRYPLGPGEALINYANTYAARAWWGIRPFDSYVHLWGHSHLFAGGMRGRIAKAKRRVADDLINATRLNAYDMTEAALHRHYTDMCSSRPSFLVGYTSAVVKLAHFIERTGLDTCPLKAMKAVIVTAETVTELDARIIGRVFATPVVTEYGSAETGTIAVSRGGTWPLQVLWDSFALTVGPDDALAVTTLSPRLFPLIRYGIGDQVTAMPDSLGNVHELAAVRGRAHDVIRVGTVDGDALELSAILPVHILKNDNRVISVQFRQETEHRLRIFVQAGAPITVPEISSFFAQRLQLDHPSFDPSSVEIEMVREPKLTKAGKHALFVS